MKIITKDAINKNLGVVGLKIIKRTMQLQKK